MEFGFRFSSENPSATIPATKLIVECNRAKAAMILFFKYRPFWSKLRIQGGGGSGLNIPLAKSCKLRVPSQIQTHIYWPPIVYLLVSIRLSPPKWVLRYLRLCFWYRGNGKGCVPKHPVQHQMPPTKTYGTPLSGVKAILCDRLSNS